MEKVSGFWIGLILAALVATLSYRVRFLTVSGSVGALVLGTVIFGLGGLPWVFALLVFFLASSLLSKLGAERKKDFRAVFEKASTRDLAQVLANGGVPGAIVLANALLPSPIWCTAYLGALGTATADTWGTEIGILSASRPRLITDLKTVDPGTSGAVSFIGLTGSVLGSLLIASTGLAFYPYLNVLNLTAIWLAGIAGALADSLLGATLQREYTCPKCLQQTERPFHCEETSCRLTSGISWLGNDAVNALSSLYGAIFALIVDRLLDLFICL